MPQHFRTHQVLVRGWCGFESASNTALPIKVLTSDPHTKTDNSPRGVNSRAGVSTSPALARGTSLRQLLVRKFQNRTSATTLPSKASSRILEPFQQVRSIPFHPISQIRTRVAADGVLDQGRVFNPSWLKTILIEDRGQPTQPKGQNKTRGGVTVRTSITGPREPQEVREHR